MIYSNKIPPTDKNLSALLIDSGWIKIKEPKNFLATLMLSIPFMIINAVIIFLIVPPIKVQIIETLEKLEYGGITFTIDITILLYILAIFAFLIAHELLHAVFIPDFIKSRKTFWGITSFGGFVSTTEEISKLRFILISIFPIITLSVIMPWLFIMFDLFSSFVAFLVIVNAMASSVDILNMLLIVIQVPNGSRIVNNGFETYHKPAN
jgi:hypothetical protein